MTQKTVNKKLPAETLKLQLKKIRQQPRHKIQQLVRSFEPLTVNKE